VDRLESIRQKVLAAVAPLPIERGLARDCAGMVLAEPARAVRPAPPHTCSAMDGYAVRSAEVPGPCSLPVTATVYAGDLPPGPLRAGTTARIFTGAPLPPGADAVVREEVVDLRGDVASFRHPARPGENVRPAGEDVEQGGEALPAGVRLGPRALALLAAVEVEEIRVRRRPRVVVISTGDEIVRGRTPDSNGVAVAGLVAEAGGDPVRRAVGDRREEVEREIARALASSDAVLTIGGASVGERDHVPAALAALGADVRVHGVPMKPGKPFLFAVAGGKPVLGLPGSPSACLVAFEVFARPALLRLAGVARPYRPVVRLPVAEAVSGKPGRARFLWAALEPDGRVRPQGRDAAQVRGPALADALVRLPEDAGDVAAGEEVEAWLLGGA